jgi:hypothetical protein
LRLSILITLLAPAVFGEIRYVAAKKLWRLEAGPVSYIIGINERNDLEPLY